MLSDLHVGGKSALTIANIKQNLLKALNEFNNPNIIILGDLFDIHCSKEYRTEFSEFLKSLNITITLILGNHDRLNADEYAKCGIKSIYKELVLDMFILTHKPISTDKFNIHGHLHPGFTKRKLVIKNDRPCFVVANNSICLPAFSGITGKNVFNTNSNQNIYSIKDDSIVLC